MTKTKTKIGLYVTEKRDGDYYHVIATVVTIGPNAWERQSRETGSYAYPNITEDTIRNAGSEVENGLYLQNLRVSSQGENTATERRLYGFEVRYQDVYAIDLRDAERMAKTLRRLTTKLEQLDAKYGHAQTFGGYLARVAAAIGAEEIVRPGKHQRGWSYSENEQIRQTIKDGAWAVDHLVTTWATRATEAA